MSIPAVSFNQFAAQYCETQECTPEKLREILEAQVANYQPNGFILLECAMMGSTRLGERCILPYGPNNTFKQIPTHPVSPRGIASDMSVVIAVLPASWLRPS